MLSDVAYITSAYSLHIIEYLSVMSCMHACMYRDQLYNYYISIHAGGHLG